MLFNRTNITKCIIGMLAMPFSSFASPLISVDSVEVNVGNLMQNEFKAVTHTYIMKNTGDSTLIITNVKPGCGCTTVGHDSIIAPGKTGKMTASIDAKALSAGTFRKFITIHSNAKNTPEIRVSLGGTIKTAVQPSSQSLHLTSKDQKIWTDSLTLSTDKADLSISEVSFKPYGADGAAAPAWQSDLKMYLKYTFTKSDSAMTNNTHLYNLKLFFSIKDSEPKYGEFFIKTNHPKMPEIKINGLIDGLGLKK